jgi:hypothetical protein
MTIVQLLSKFGLQMAPAVCASLLSAAVLGALQFTPGPAAQVQRGGAEANDATVYVDVMPRINRDPAPAAAAAVPPAPAAAVQPAAAEEPAAPAKIAPRQQATAPPAERERKVRNAASPRADAVAAAKAEAAPVTVEPTPAKIELAPVRVEAAVARAEPNLAPPLPIANAALPVAPGPAEPARFLGMPVPEPVSAVGGAVVDVAKLPIHFADTLVARPVWRIVNGVAGWVNPGAGR